VTEPATDHPGADALCDLDEGLLAGTTGEAELQAHVAVCAACADFLAMLATTRARLAAVADEPMPPDVAARIDAALAAEAAVSSDRASSEGAVVTPLRARRSQRSRWLPGAGAVAAGVALLMAGAIGIGAITSIDRRSGPISGAAGDRSASTGGAPRETSGVRNYTPLTLADGVRALVGSEATAIGPPQGKQSGRPAPQGAQQDAVRSADLARLRAPDQLAACVAELAGKQGVPPLAVDYARFQGAPAVLIVLPGPDAATVAAWVVGPACTTGRADLRRYQVVPTTG